MKKILKNPWVVGIGVALILYYLGIGGNSHTVEVKGNVTGSIVAPSGGNNTINNNNFPATYIATSTISSQPDGKYIAIVKVSSNEGIRPAYLCVNIKSDVPANPYGKPAIKNDGQLIAATNVSLNLACISDPSSHISAYFILNTKPSYFEATVTSTN